MFRRRLLAKEDFDRSVLKVKFNGSPKGSCSGPKGIPLRARPGPLLNDHILTGSKEILRELPLKLLDSLRLSLSQRPIRRMESMVCGICSPMAHAAHSVVR